MAERSDGENGREGRLSRRDLLRGGVVAGGTLLWAAPVMQSLTPPAFAHQLSPANHFCCHCYNSNGSRSTVTRTTGYCISDGGFFPDAHAASAAECTTHCAALGFNQADFHQGPNPFTCNGVHPTSGGGCSAH